MNRLEPIIEQLRRLVIENLDPRFPPAELHEFTPLFAGGMELNSFAVVELIGLLERHFQFQFRESDFREECFRNLHTLAELVDSYRPVSASTAATTTHPN